MLRFKIFKYFFPIRPYPHPLKILKWGKHGEYMVDTPPLNLVLQADVDIAVAAAKKAFTYGSVWRTLDASQRGRLMFKLADAMEANIEYISVSMIIFTSMDCSVLKKMRLSDENYYIAYIAWLLNNLIIGIL